MTESVLDITANALEKAGVHPHRLIVRQHGHVVGRRRWAPWSSEVASLVYSCSKTFTSAAVGIAVDRGAFGYDDTLAELLPASCTEQTGPVARSITVRDVLAMASGHSPEQLSQPPLALSRIPNAQTAKLWLGTEPAGRPGVDFAYNNLGTWMLSRIVRRHTGVDIDTIITREVLEPLGCGPHSWVRDADGIPLGFSGLHIDAEDIGRFAQLLLDNGIHDGRRLLPREWVEQHRVKHVESDGLTGPEWGLGYGWQTWISSHGYRLDGAFGQFALIIPEVDAVVVTTNEVGEGPGDKQTVLQIIWDHLLPALSEGITPEPEEVVRTVPTVSGTFDSARSIQGIVDDTHIIVAPCADGWAMSWRSTQSHDETVETSLDVAIGHNRWLTSHCRVGDGSLDIAASGGWQANTFVAKLNIISSPHGLTIQIAPNATTIRWNCDPLDPRGLFGLIHPEPRQ
ncbi:serine hydrolase [Cutibacterium sp.]|uniref:serine hydrolase domain-containing protein n=1 Tax=Cutibacterium sp. TaxID=1912221 RepID=UPI0026DC1C01|nr:serine hydrolase domain-containing protein [Cutibacterium sp.]MDO4412978.1 serine hydrolase domain-containing protein [Cutibacterium sp.]